jgi:hypothetical protein
MAKPSHGSQQQVKNFKLTYASLWIFIIRLLPAKKLGQEGQIIP